ncbi:hypothetical protein LPJ59_004282 [Coemansia sp. RSA 2399]|nr:hypothetical protein LPJ59_004282 [Coemansia sp. RSA 2399]KAJ1900234.1 hypothetical protein LPJ81_003985 [Coemansia sp. IMI 209127]
MAVPKSADGDSELEIDEQTFVENTDEMDGGRKTDNCRLGRSFHGTKQSVYGWNNCFNTRLCDWMVFECLDAGQDIHVKRFDDGRVCIVTTYIDDILTGVQPDDELANIGKYQTIAGPLQCLAGSTRSDNAHAASVLGSFNPKQTVAYLCAAEHSMRNLKQSAKFSIKHSRQPAHQLAGADAAYSDYFFLLSRTH